MEAFNQACSFKQDRPPALRNQTGIFARLVPGESQGWQSLVGGRLWITQSQTRLKRLSSSSGV